LTYLHEVPEKTLIRLAALGQRIMHQRLENFNGVSDFLTAITKIKSEIERTRGSRRVEVPESYSAGAILRWHGHQVHH